MGGSWVAIVLARIVGHNDDQPWSTVACQLFPNSFPPKMSEDPQKHQNWSSLVDEFEALDLP